MVQMMMIKKKKLKEEKNIIKKVEKQEQLKREDINGQKNIKEPENINDQK